MSDEKYITENLSVNEINTQSNILNNDEIKILKKITDIIQNVENKIEEKKNQLNNIEPVSDNINNYLELNVPSQKIIDIINHTKKVRKTLIIIYSLLGSISGSYLILSNFSGNTYLTRTFQIFATISLILSIYATTIHKWYNINDWYKISLMRKNIPNDLRIGPSLIIKCNNVSTDNTNNIIKNIFEKYLYALSKYNSQNTDEDYNNIMNYIRNELYNLQIGEIEYLNNLYNQFVENKLSVKFMIEKELEDTHILRYIYYWIKTYIILGDYGEKEELIFKFDIQWTEFTNNSDIAFSYCVMVT